MHGEENAPPATKQSERERLAGRDHLMAVRDRSGGAMIVHRKLMGGMFLLLAVVLPAWSASAPASGGGGAAGPRGLLAARRGSGAGPQGAGAEEQTAELPTPQQLLFPPLPLKKKHHNNLQRCSHTARGVI